MEKMKIEQERKKAIFAQEAAKEKDRKSFTIETVSSTPAIDVRSLLLLVLTVIEGFQLYLNLLPYL